VRGRNAVGVEHTGGVADHVRAGVLGTPGLVGDRPPGVALVVADHEPPAVREHPAEVVLPPDHRAAASHDQEDRRVARVAERLGAELDAVGLDHPLHLISRSRRVRPQRAARERRYGASNYAKAR
jgi:hypothetical protein